MRLLRLYIVVLLFLCSIDAQVKGQQAAENDFYKIYTEILSPKCSLSGCHDGSFEPNYTSIYSSYNSLVYHPLVKNNRNGDFRFRVVPFKSAESVFFERITNNCFVDEGDRMPFYDQEGLAESDIQLIKKWIDEGCKDLDLRTPETLCLPINVHNIDIFASIDKSSIEINEYFIDPDGEVQGLSLPRETDNIRIYLSLSDDMLRCKDINYNTYFIKCVQNYEGQTKETKLKLRFNKDKTLAFAQIASKRLKNFDKLFLYLSNDAAYLFPHQEVLFTLFSKWILVKET